MDLDFEIDRQHIKRIDKEKPIRDTQEYISLNFSFTEDWHNLDKRIIFNFEDKYYQFNLENNTCNPPIDVLQNPFFYISIYGVDCRGMKRITTNKLLIPLEESGYKNCDFTPASSPSKDIFTNIYDEIHNIKPYSSIKYIKDYLYELSFDVLDYENAEQYFLKINNLDTPSCCTSIRNGNFYGRNLDWVYNNDVEFIIKTNNINNKFATIGVASNTGLENNFVKTKQYSELYKILPFMVVDAINENGLLMSTNVVPLDKTPTTETVPDVEVKNKICSKMLIRFCVDNFSTARECIDYLKNYVSIYVSNTLHDIHYEQHWMIADENETYVIELINNKIVEKEISNNPYMTNFYLTDIELNEDGSVYTPETQTEEFNAIDTNKITPKGCGLERFNLINSRFNEITSRDDLKILMNDLKYTNTYSLETNPIWYTEFVDLKEDLTVASSPSEYTNVVNKTIEVFNNRSRDKESEYYGTWQTTHSSIYDIENKKLYIIVQEDEEELEFNLDYGYNTKQFKITNIINEQSTDNEIPTAKAVWNLFKSLQ